jgi:hypothetical protein
VTGGFVKCQRATVQFAVSTRLSTAMRIYFEADLLEVHRIRQVIAQRMYFIVSRERMVDQRF